MSANPAGSTEQRADVRAIAFYLPQFHPVPENDQWWGKGFTEWTNVTRAVPQFPGHWQPHLPADLGFYDLRLPEVREAQAALARESGIHGFCYYHYWFNGRLILERPFTEVLRSGRPDLPFCLCWANENWTRAWDGGTHQALLEQHYSAEDDRAHMLHLAPALRDPRYIRIGGRPLLLLYRTELLPDPGRTAEVWRSVAREQGVGDLYLARVESFRSGIDPASIGFDAAVEFAPAFFRPLPRVLGGPLARALGRIGLLPGGFGRHRVHRYRRLVETHSRLPEPDYRWFRCVTPMWDNTARRKAGAGIYIGSTPAQYGEWLRRTAARTRQRHEGEERLVFINAWNEWAEGCHLEPDQKWGRQYLVATREALEVPAAAAPAPVLSRQAARAPAPASAPASARLYWRLRERLAPLSDALRAAARRPLS